MFGEEDISINSANVINSFFFLLQGNHNADSIEQRIAGLELKLAELEAMAGQRRGGLVDNSAFLQFMWKTDVVDSWIGKQSPFHSLS